MVRNFFENLFLSSIALLMSIVFGYASVYLERGHSEFYLPVASTLMDGDVKLSPIAAVKFCLENHNQCHAGEAHRIRLTPSLWQTMQNVNGAINTKIVPDPNKSAYDWSLTTVHGNCNDYAVQKRERLIAYGFPASSLSLAVVHLASGEGHLVLFIRTDRGDFILDNLNDDIRGQAEAGYQLIKWQSAENPHVWVAIRPAFSSFAAHVPNGDQARIEWEWPRVSYFAPRLDFAWIGMLSEHTGMMTPVPERKMMRLFEVSAAQF